MTLAGKAIDPNKTYKVAGWASMQPLEGEPIWDVVSRWLQAKKTIAPVPLKEPVIKGLSANQGLA